jgi:hypothetical protein
MLDPREMAKFVDSTASVKVLDKEWIQAYDVVSSLESGRSYVVGSPQGLTRLLMSEQGTYPRKDLLLTRKDLQRVGNDVVQREFIDYSALAPLNLSLGRLTTFNELPRSHRASVRFRLLQKVHPDTHPDMVHILGRVQFAALSIAPVPLLDRELHKKYWVAWSAMARAMKNPTSWQAIAVCLKLKDGSEVKGWL